MSERGVSEVIGFVLIFSLITLSVGTVYVVGFGGLQQARDAEQLTNVERAFDVLADNMNDIVAKDAPNRATELRLYNADIGVREPTRFTVRITNLGTPVPTYSVNAYPIVYEPLDSPTTIRYLDGAVIRQDRGGATFLDDPPFVFREEGSERTAVIPLVQTRSSGVQSVGGTGTVLVRANRVVEETLTARTGSDFDVELTVESGGARASLWERHLNERLRTAYGLGSDPCAPTGTPGEIRCTFTVQRLYVTATRIDVSIEN